MKGRKNMVSDHAIVRYLERVYGVDIAALRRRIEKTTDGARSQGARAVVSQGVRYVLSAGGKVITIHGAFKKVSKRGRRWKARRK